MTTAPASAPIFTFDGVVRLTRIGTTYVIFTIVIGFAAINTGNNALYIGLTFMLGCLLLSGVASKGGLKHLQIELRGIEEAWAGRPVNAILRVRNGSRIWNVRDVVITSNELAAAAVMPVIQKRSEIDMGVDFLFRRRGIVTLKRIDCYTRYPFGFFLKKRRIPLSGEVVVFPRLLADSFTRERFRAVAGEETATNRPGPGEDIHSLREYIRGDSLRHVHWKKSASLGRWVMKQTELEAARSVHVAVDPFKPRGVSDDEFEEMVSAAATFLYQAVRRGFDVMLTLPRASMRATGEHSAHALFRALAILEPAHEPVHQVLDRDTILFSLRTADARQTA